MNTKSQQFNRENIINAHKQWMDELAYPYFVTLSYNYQSVTSLVRAKKSLSRFFNALDKKVRTKEELAMGQRIERMVYIESGKSGTNYHSHFFYKPKSQMDNLRIQYWIHELWTTKVRFAEDVVIKTNGEGDDRHGYCMKEYFENQEDKFFPELSVVLHQ